MEIDAEIAKNVEKYNVKLRKQGIHHAKLNAAARTNTKSISSRASYQSSSIKRPVMTEEEKEKARKESTEYYNSNAKAGSLASKANMVKQYNEKNNK